MHFSIGIMRAQTCLYGYKPQGVDITISVKRERLFGKQNMVISAEWIMCYDKYDNINNDT